MCQYGLTSAARHAACAQVRGWLTPRGKHFLPLLPAPMPSPIEKGSLPRFPSGRACHLICRQTLRLQFKFLRWPLSFSIFAGRNTPSINRVGHLPYCRSVAKMPSASPIPPSRAMNPSAITSPDFPYFPRPFRLPNPGAWVLNSKAPQSPFGPF